MGRYRQHSASAGASLGSASDAEHKPAQIRLQRTGAVLAVELLSDRDASDPVSQVLRLLRVRSSVYCRSVMGAPWGFGVEPHGNPAFHVVTAGSCWLEVHGDPQQIPLETGDLVILPIGSRHWMRDDPDSPATELEEILSETPLDDHHRLHYGGSGQKTGLLCGGFALDGGHAHPILRALPPALRVRGIDGRPVPWLAATLELLNAETASDAPGSEEVVSASPTRCSRRPCASR